MHKFLLCLIGAVLIRSLLVPGTAWAQTTTYSEKFANGVGYAVGSSQYDNWDTFRSGAPSSGIQSVTISGSRDSTGRTCSNASAAQLIMNGLRNGWTLTAGCDGIQWRTGRCGGGIELNSGSANGVCACNDGNYVVRPTVGSGTADWGGINGDTCSAPSQTMSVSYTMIAAASPLVVTTTADTNSIGTLRHAILHANANPADDDITFNIPGAGPHVITIGAALPTITDAGVSIDGSTQPGASCGNLWGGIPHTLMIRLDSGSATNPKFNLLQTDAADTLIKGLSITRFHHGLIGGGLSSGFSVQCNYVGLAPDGTASGNFGNAIRLAGSAARVGGLGAGEGNVVSSNGIGVITANGSTDTAIRGNFIGTDPTGTAARSHSTRAINHLNGSGTWRDITRNLISGNNGLPPGLGAITLEGDTISPSNGRISIAGNFIGVDRTGTAPLPNISRGIYIPDTNTITNLVIGGTSAADRNVIGGNGGDGILLLGQSGVSILGNYIGLGANGSTDLGNGGQGIHLSNVTNVAIGNGTASGRNVISNNGDGPGEQGIFVSDTANLTIRGNFIGTASDGVTLRGNENNGITFQSTQTQSGHSNATVTANVIAGNGVGGIDISSYGMGVLGAHSSITISGNLIGVGANGMTPAGNGEFGIKNTNVPGAILIGGNGAGNLIAFNAGSGVVVTSVSGTTTAIVANRIHSNGALGIDLGQNGIVEANDTGDGDSGANDLLNFPAIGKITADGTTLIEYDIALDVPAHGAGYRIDFFKNTTFETNGEGEIHLGSVDVTGSGTHTGSFTTNASVAVGDYIAATTTRIVSGATYDITSEFSVSVTATAAGTNAALAAVKTVAPLEPGGYSLPGSDMLCKITLTNQGDGHADTDSIFIVDRIPPEVVFFNGDHDGAGPSTDRVGFSETATTLTFDPVTDVRFSSAATQPTDFVSCGYTPASGYDPAVSFICFNPKGQMAGGDPDPSFSLSFRVRIN